MTYIFLLLFSSLLSSFSIAQAEDLKEKLFRETSSRQVSLSYTSARIKLYNHLYLQRDINGYYIEGVYCQRKHYPFQGNHPNDRIPNHTVFNTEHTWPQSKFSKQFRKATQKSDLHHLFPTYSRINSERGNLPFAEVNKRRDLFCEESQSGSATRGDRGNYFEPPHEHKGNVARAMFYFSIRYKISIDPIQEHYLRLWHKEDPVDTNEKIRHEKIYKIQRNRNPFIDNPGLVSRIRDF